MSSPPEGKLETKAGHPPAGTDCFALCLGAPVGGGAASGSPGPEPVRRAGAQKILGTASVAGRPPCAVFVWHDQGAVVLQSKHV
ncbi:death-associated protein 1 isoform X2 [Meriones unguiculatus]|uniref:death-associated protein 1 isoform X2 n=1 Tax=Meriones unguiculatus TaxID=10047 RepID=UPI00293F3DAB|nr:death-associated protein 1 isoform X2 [Meriones unguiculatus]